MENHVVAFNPIDGINPKHRKEHSLYQTYDLLSIEDGKIVEKATLKIYQPGTVAYACLWVYNQNGCSGSGTAGGGGYHKPSAAGGRAFEAAGITLEQHIEGAGEQAIKDALLALGKRLGLKNPYVHNAHG